MRMESHADVGRYFSTWLIIGSSLVEIKFASTCLHRTTIQQKMYTISLTKIVFLLWILNQCLQDWVKTTWYNKFNKPNYKFLFIICPIPMWPNFWTFFFTLHLCFTNSFALQMFINPSSLLDHKLCSCAASVKTFLSSSLACSRNMRWVN